MWLTIVVGYCLLCWLAGFILVRVVWSQVFAAMAEQSAIPLLPLELAVVLLMPILMPCLLCLGVGCIYKVTLQARQLQQVSRKFRPYEFVPVDSQLVEESIGQQFERYTPPLVHLGFTFLGDYRLKPQPLEVHDRVFLSRDGEILGAICALLDDGAVSLISVLENGTCVHTCAVTNPHPERTFDASDRLHISYMPEAPVENLYLHHLHALRECSSDSASSVLRFREDQFREVLTYDQLIFCRWRFRHGGLDNEPPAPDLRTLCGTPAVLAESSAHS